jgi:hypothetical protein
VQFGYARVSKGEDQSTATQRKLLREAGAALQAPTSPGTL